MKTTHKIIASILCLSSLLLFVFDVFAVGIGNTVKSSEMQKTTPIAQEKQSLSETDVLREAPSQEHRRIEKTWT